jgi:predicted Zn-dependent peptidase
MWDPYAEFQSTTLPNGLSVHAAHWPGRPWEAIGFVVHSGAEQDPVGLEGLAHFAEHLVSKNAPVPQKSIAAFFEDCGGGVNFGSTGYFSTKFDFFVPANKIVLGTAFAFFAQMLLGCRLEKLIERERQVIVGEFHRKYPVEFGFDLDMRERRSLYPGLWRERSVIPLGSPKSIEQITEADLQTYYDAHFTPANISVVGVGGMQFAELVDVLSRSHLAEGKPGTRTPLPQCLTDIRAPMETHHVFELSLHAQLSTPMEVGYYRSVAVIPGRVNTAIRILKFMLDEILDDEVRQSRAWTYRIASDWCNFLHFHEFMVNCGAMPLNALDAIENVVEECIASLTDREDLFENARRREIASNLMADPNGRKVRDFAMEDLTEYHRIISLAEYGAELEVLTMDDIRKMLPWIRPERRWTLIRKP